MRRFFALATILALSACGGGGGGTSVPSNPGGTAPTPTPVPTTGTQSTYSRPTFTITIPSTPSANAKKNPAFVSSGALSVSIALTSDSAGIGVGLLAPNPAVTNVNGSTGINCNTGCTVSGPPSPPGTDGYTITLYTLANAGGTALDTGSQSYAIAEGSSNAESMILEGIPATLSFTVLPTTWSAGTANGGGAGLTVSVTAADALGNTITGTYVNAVTLTDPDTNGDGTRVVAASCPGTYPTGNTAISATTATFTGSSSTAVFCYGGLAENPVTLTATASGATSGTRSFSPILNLPVSGTTTGAFVGTDAQLEATSGTGSTGTIAWTESGWTNAPYNQTLAVDSAAVTCSPGGPLSTFATVSPAFSSNTTVFTVTSASPYTPGKCTVPVYDGVTGTNAYTPPTFSASYTSSGFTVDAHNRH
ncbi:MAG TPA: hypothetical protein VMD91_03375 [Candidatus Sulfotelmatobacter sp.]|nr:hypothetical protein [Candidatus Sulfotelmatobacter sp.]